jgi:NADH-quinone oxidoreductase subunit A
LCARSGFQGGFFLTLEQAWPVATYLLFVLLIAGGMIGISHLLGQRHKERATGEVYESGVLPVGGSKLKFTAHFYLIAMMFVIFDLEAVFLFAWAVSARELGWIGYLEVLTFVLFLLAAFAYLFRMGAFDVIPKSPIPARKDGGS